LLGRDLSIQVQYDVAAVKTFHFEKKNYLIVSMDAAPYFNCRGSNYMKGFALPS